MARQQLANHLPDRPHAISLMKAGPRQCRFILNDPPARPLCCGAPVTDGSWCPSHRRLVYARPSDIGFGRMKFRAVVSLCVLIACGSGALADCEEARDHYLSAVEEIREHLGRYVQCITTSNGLVDCSSEFRRLSNAHTEFEKAVEEFRSECP
jgi:hypothetical protein